MKTTSVQRAAVTIATVALLLTGVGLTVAAGTALSGDPPGPIVSDRSVEAVVETAIDTSTPPAAAPVAEPAPSPPVPERSLPAPRWNAAPSEPDKPKAEIKKPEGDKDKDQDDEDDEDDHETVKPPVRDEEEDDEHDVIDEHDGDVKD